MKNKKLLKLIAAISLVACLCICPLCMGNARTARAEAEEIVFPDDELDVTFPTEGENTPLEPAEPPVIDEPTDGEETGEDSLKSLIEGFMAQLRAKYGDEYETYYNAILSDWGSVEQYLLSLVNEETPDEVAKGWTAFVKWLGEYSPVWGSILAGVLVIFVLIFGKNALNKVVNWATDANGKFKTLFEEINKIDAAQAAQNSALLKLLGENGKFQDERDELKKTGEDIKHGGL